jgi:homopolymeric O-antigen transport system ATP-binding protein
MKKIIFQFKNIGVYYNRQANKPWKRQKFWPLKDVSFDVHHGETVGIVGKNGAGKSTILRVAASIIDPNRGQFIQEPGITASLLSLNAGANMMLTGRQNIFLTGLTLGIDKRVIAASEEKIIELSELGDFIDEPVKTYSSGMVAKLGFSIAHFMDPDVLLIDETLSVGDQKFRKKSATLLKEKINSDKTVMIVSHSPQSLEELCDRIIYIDNGISMPELSVTESLEKYLQHPAKKEG